jgi:hypothetical protein
MKKTNTFFINVLLILFAVSCTSQVHEYSTMDEITKSVNRSKVKLADLSIEEAESWFNSTLVKTPITRGLRQNTLSYLRKLLISHFHLLISWIVVMAT